MEDIIITEKLTRRYGDTAAVSDLSLNVKRGEIYGFLGLNGAGKTTTIRMLLGMIRPTSGTAHICGTRVTENNKALWSRIGYMVEVPHAYPNLTVTENLTIIARLRGLKDRNAVSRIIEQLQLGTYAHREAQHLSLGNAQRLGLAKALIHAPEVLILDEPSNGLDPAGIQEIRELLCHLAGNHGVTVFISSHILDEVAKFATRVGIINRSTLVEEVNTAQLEQRSRRRLLIRCRNQEAGQDVLQRAGYTVQHLHDDVLECKDAAAIAEPDRVATLLVNEGYPPQLLQVETEGLESYFLRTIKEHSNERIH